MKESFNCCVVIPYKNKLALLERCLSRLLEHLPPYAIILLVDDGSTQPQSKVLLLAENPNIHRLVNDQSRGPAAARNRAFCWCREHEVDTVILLDSDCVPEPDFVATHVMLMNDHPEAVCIGGSIRGAGKGIWAKIDGMASWFTSIPGTKLRRIQGIYHIPTTNMSIRFNALTPEETQFDERLRTGEDVKFARMLSERGRQLLFSPVPTVEHFDRERMGDMLRHQYRWGLHTYAMRFGAAGHAAKRFLLAILFLPAIPGYAFVASSVNLLPWLAVSWFYIRYWPILFLLYMYKGIGVLEGILWPEHALWPTGGH